MNFRKSIYNWWWNSGFDPNLQSLLSQANSSNIVSPSSIIQSALGKFITDLKSYGLWTNTFDVCYITITDAANNFTTFNIINPSAYQFTRNLDPQFIVNGGIKNNGIDTYIDIPWKPSLGVNFTQNNCESIIYYKNIPNAFNANISDGCRQANGQPTLAFNPQSASNTFDGRINGDQALFVDAQFDLSDGLYFLGRTSSSSVFAKKGSGSRITVGSNTSGTPSANDVFIGALNQAGSPLASTYSSRTIGLFAAGRLLTTTEEANFKTAWDTYMTTVNAQSLPATIGTIYNKNSWASLADFTDNGSGASVSGGKINMSTGSGVFTKTLDLTQATKLAKWSMTAQFSVASITSTSFGLGLGIRSANTSQAISCCGMFHMETANQGKIFIYAGNSMTNTATSGSAVSFSANDIISMTVTLDESLMTVSAFNVTTAGAAVTLSWDFITGASPQNSPNTGRFALFSVGGSLSVSSLTVSSTEYYQPKLLILGDSKTQYYKASRMHLGLSYLIRDYRGSQNIAIYGGGSDRSAEYMLTYNDIINTIKPKNVLIIGVSNDVRTSSTAYQANLVTITNALTAAGINWIISDGVYETSIDQSSVTTWMNANIAIGNRWNSNTTVVALNADNVHPSNAGCVTFANAYLISGKMI